MLGWGRLRGIEIGYGVEGDGERDARIESQGIRRGEWWSLGQRRIQGRDRGQDQGESSSWGEDEGEALIGIGAEDDSCCSCCLKSIVTVETTGLMSLRGAGKVDWWLEWEGGLTISGKRGGWVGGSLAFVLVLVADENPTPRIQVVDESSAREENPDDERKWKPRYRSGRC